MSKMYLLLLHQEILTVSIMHNAVRRIGGTNPRQIDDDPRCFPYHPFLFRDTHSIPDTLDDQ